jgi:hypothetical protein
MRSWPFHFGTLSRFCGTFFFLKKRLSRFWNAFFTVLFYDYFSLGTEGKWQVESATLQTVDDIKNIGHMLIFVVRKRKES